MDFLFPEHTEKPNSEHTSSTLIYRLTEYSQALQQNPTVLIGAI